MVVGATEKRSYALGAALMVGVPALAAVGLAGAGLAWASYPLAGLALLGLFYWFREGMLLSLTLFPDGLRISQLGGSDFLYYSVIQRISRTGSGSYALVLQNGLVVRLPLNLFINKQAIAEDLERLIGEYARKSGAHLELP